MITFGYQGVAPWPVASESPPAELTGVRSRQSAPTFGEEIEQPGAGGRAYAALGNQPCHEPRRCHVERIVGGRAVARCEADSDAPPVVAPALDMGNLAAVALLDRDLGSALDLPIDTGRGKRDVKRDVLVTGRQRLRICADLVGDIAASRGAIGTDDAEIDEALVHHVAGGIIDNDRMRDTMLGQLPGGQPGTLVARPCLVDPDMEWDAIVMRAVDRGERGSPIDGGEPAGVAMGQNIDPSTRALSPIGLGDHAFAVPADCTVDRDIGFGDLARPRQSYLKPSVLRNTPERALHIRQRPTQIDGGR